LPWSRLGQERLLEGCSQETTDIVAQIRFTLPAKAVAPSIARGTLDPLRSRLPDDSYFTVQLLVTELITNSLRHAQFRDHEAIDIEVDVDENRTRVCVCDPGGDSLPRLVEQDLESTGGRGLFLVDAMADHWGVRTNNRTCVWFELAKASSR
jgi:anti-sigma regulatory factor (Ser/Thr protein kinase)